MYITQGIGTCYTILNYYIRLNGYYIRWVLRNRPCYQPEFPTGKVSAPPSPRSNRSPRSKSPDVEDVAEQRRN